MGEIFLLANLQNEMVISPFNTENLIVCLGSLLITAALVPEYKGHCESSAARDLVWRLLHPGHISESGHNS